MVYVEGRWGRGSSSGITDERVDWQSSFTYQLQKYLSARFVDSFCRPVIQCNCLSCVNRVYVYDLADALHIHSYLFTIFHSDGFCMKGMKKGLPIIDSSLQTYGNWITAYKVKSRHEVVYLCSSSSFPLPLVLIAAFSKVIW